MSLAPLVGHDDLRSRLRHAVEAGRLPQSLLFVGSTGIGKQRLALWLAGLVVCEDADPAARPCGACRSCRLANDLQHPDIHWFFPLPSPKGGSTPAKRREKLEEARHEELAGRRETPVRASSVDTADSIFLAVVEEIRSKASLRPAMGSSTVFVIGDADRMVPQASSPEAANAFLKLLEEPPPDTLLFLTSSRPGALLPTIRSRVLSVRVTSPPGPVAETFLTEHGGMEPATASRLARRFEGSIGLALRAAEEEDPRDEAVQVLACALSGSWEQRLAMAARYPSFGGRGRFSAMLGALDGAIRDAAAASAGNGDVALDPELGRRLPAARNVPVEAWLACVPHVEEALDAAAGNGNPEAIVAVLLQEMAGELGGRTERRSTRQVSKAGDE